MSHIYYNLYFIHDAENGFEDCWQEKSNSICSKKSTTAFNTE